MKSEITTNNTIKPHYIGGFFVRSLSEHSKVKIYVHVYSDGRHVQHKLYLTDRKELPGCKVLCTKFGKTLHIQSTAYKYPTMAVIYKTVSEIMVDNNVKPEDILL